MSQTEEKNQMAVAENRLISVREGKIRMRVGYGLLIGMVVAYAYEPSVRECYGPLSLVSAIAMGVWRTGKESL
jgi:hypothetical protein